MPVRRATELYRGDARKLRLLHVSPKQNACASHKSAALESIEVTGGSIDVAEHYVVLESALGDRSRDDSRPGVISMQSPYIARIDRQS